MGLGNATDRISVSLYEDRSVWHETNLAYISEIEKKYAMGRVEDNHFP